MADEKEKRPIFDPAQPREILFPLVQGEDQQKPLFDLRGPIKGFFRSIANAAAFIADASERQLSDEPFDDEDKIFEEAIYGIFGIRLSEGSPTIEAAGRAKKLKAANPDHCDLTLGAPDGGIAPELKERLPDPRELNYDYTATGGEAAVVKTIVDGVIRRLNYPEKFGEFPLDAALVNGSKEGLYLGLKVLCSQKTEEGQKIPVLLTAPYWPSHVALIKLAGGEPVIIDCPKEQGYKISDEQFEEVLKKYPNLIWLFSNTANPTGALYSDSELGAKAEIQRKHPNSSYVEDGLYRDTTFDGDRPTPYAVIAPDLKGFRVDGLAKRLGVPSMRAAFLLGPSPAIKEDTNIKSHISGNVSVYTQKVLQIVFDPENDGVFENHEARKNEQYKNRLNVLDSFMERVDIKRERTRSTFYGYYDLKDLLKIGLMDPETNEPITTDVELCAYWEKHGVSGIAGTYCGDKGAVRLSCSASDVDVQRAGEYLERSTKALRLISNPEKTFEDYLKNPEAFLPQDTQQPLVVVAGGSGRG
jgi:aspartate aminotransferase